MTSFGIIINNINNISERWLNFTARSDPYSTVSWFVVVLVQRCAHSVRFVCVCPSSFYDPNVELQ